MAGPTFTGKYAGIRKDLYKGIMGQKYSPDARVYIGNQTKTYKTEKGFYTALAKKFSDEMAKVDAIEKAGLPVQGTFTAYYPARSYQARASVSFKTSTGSYKTYEGGPTGGWGYDKMSSALAEAFNKSPEFLKILMDARARKKTLPYGVSLDNGKPRLPRWNGGVGTECFVSVLEACGYDVQYTHTGIPDSTSYTFTAKRVR